VASRWLGKATGCRLEISWQDGTSREGGAVTDDDATQPGRGVGVCLAGAYPGKSGRAAGELLVTNHGDGADYRARKRKAVLEVSGTEIPAELGRRHREKVAQARGNPFGWDAYVVVCAFSAEGQPHPLHQTSLREARYVEGKD